MADYSVTASNNVGTAWQAFDKKIATGWESEYDNSTIMFDFGVPTIIKGVRFTPLVNKLTAFPTSILLKAGDSTSSLEDVDTFETTKPTTNVPQSFVFESTVKHRYYSFKFVGTFDNSMKPTVADIEFMVYRDSIVSSGIDTSDATATASDIAEGKTAYVDGEKVVGIANVVSDIYGFDTPKMTGNNTPEPYKVIGDDPTLDNYTAFDGDDDTYVSINTWTSSTGSGMKRLIFDFGTITKINGLQIKVPDVVDNIGKIVNMRLYGFNEAEYYEDDPSHLLNGEEIYSSDNIKEELYDLKSIEMTFDPVAYRYYTIEFDTDNNKPTPISEVYFKKYIRSGVDPLLQEKNVTPSTDQQIINPDEGYDGLLKVTVEPIKLQDKLITPSSTQQIVVPDASHDGLSKVTVGAVSLQNKTVSPSTITQTIVPTEDYVGLSKVVVNAIPSQYIRCSGSVTLIMKTKTVFGGIKYQDPNGSIRTITSTDFNNNNNTYTITVALNNIITFFSSSPNYVWINETTGGLMLTNLIDPSDTASTVGNGIGSYYSSSVIRAFAVSNYGSSVGTMTLLLGGNSYDP